jgi:hypothetical protein
MTKRKKKKMDLRNNIDVFSSQYCMWCKDHLSKRWSTTPNCKKCEMKEAILSIHELIDIIEDFSEEEPKQWEVFVAGDGENAIHESRLYKNWQRAKDFVDKNV